VFGGRSVANNRVTIPSKQSRLTIHDVAKLAGVSTATVSKVLNNARHVSSGSRESVLRAVEMLGYRPNSAARSLKTKTTRTLGLVTDDLEGVFTMPLMRGVEEAASQHGFSVFLGNSYGDPDKERNHLQVLLAKQVDGVILLSGYRVKERGSPYQALGGVPVVYLYQYTRDADIPCVVPDDEGGAKVGVEHLVNLGRRRIALINGPLSYEATHLRFEGYRAALRDSGIPFDPALITVGEWREDSGYALAHELMSLPEPPDAIFCASDLLAVGALHALRGLGTSVPEEVSVLGFDDRPFSAQQRPALSTVALPLYDMGKLAGGLLVSMATGESVATGTTLVPCSLVVRQSCGGSQ
jgi:LacI family transcriptional regulator